MFDTSIGRWMQDDPEGFAAGDMNLYRFCGNDPVNRIDPSGRGFVHAPFVQVEISKHPWTLDPNWKRATGDLVFTSQTAEIDVAKITTGDEAKLVDDIWAGLKDFREFNSGNIATVRLVRGPDGILTAGFTTNNLGKQYCQGFGSGDGPWGEVYVRLFVDDKNHKVTAVTLGNHMIVGVREWTIDDSVDDREKDPKSPLKQATIRIRTEAWEQRNNALTDWGFTHFGHDDMIKIWDVYLHNIADSALTRLQGIRGGKGDEPDVLFQKPYSEPHPPTMKNPFSEDLPPDFRQP